MELEFFKGVVENVSAQVLLAMMLWFLINRVWQSQGEIKRGLLNLAKLMHVSNLMHDGMTHDAATKKAEDAFNTFNERKGF